MEPINKIDPQYTSDPEIVSYKSLARWSHEKGYTTPDGTLYGLPILGNLQLFYYRGDKFRGAGLAAPPREWNDVVTAAKKLHDLTKPFYGYSIRGRRGNPVVYNFLPVLRSFGGDIFVDAPFDWTVRIDDGNGLKALNFYLSLKKWCPPGVGDIGQGDIIGLLSTDRVAQAIVVAAAYSHFANPKESTIPFKVDCTVIPKARDGVHATTVGVWMMGIPTGSIHKKAAFEFMKWATSKESQIMFAKFGGVPVRADVYTSPLAEEKRFRYLRAMSEEDWLKYLMILPLLLVIVLLSIVPLAHLIRLAFSSYDFSEGSMKFNGLRNFYEMMKDKLFLHSIRNTLLYVTVSIIAELLMGLGLALLVRGLLQFKSLVRTLFLVPMLVAPVAVGLVWKLIYRPDIGVVNLFLRSIGLGNYVQGWLADVRWAMPAIIVAEI